MSSASSSRDNTSAEPCLFAGKLVKHLHTLMRLSQSSYVLHFDRDSGVLELVYAIITGVITLLYLFCRKEVGGFLFS